EAIRAQTGVFEAVALWFPQSVNLTGVDEPQRLVGSFVSASFFDVLGLPAERGRLFTEEESAPGTVKPVVVLAHRPCPPPLHSRPARDWRDEDAERHALDDHRRAGAAVRSRDRAGRWLSLRRRRVHPDRAVSLAERIACRRTGDARRRAAPPGRRRRTRG